ncbi:hypothetical protein CABS02_03377 [Colletotrichum abscissum]|uniref:Uncharacterized protein n=1 Tax=Colletotrichum abscissum TaxID=1671311 RepID=A0A9Q0B936_9PEZI|nr:hypothetical protein CABS02_03377 [Colletotrichum abscissum]
MRPAMLRAASSLHMGTMVSGQTLITHTNAGSYVPMDAAHLDASLSRISRPLKNASYSMSL